MKIKSKAILETTFTVNRKPTGIKKELERLLDWKEIYNIQYGFDSGYEFEVNLSGVLFLVDLLFVPTNQRKTRVVIRTELGYEIADSFGTLYHELLEKIKYACSYSLAMGVMLSS